MLISYQCLIVTCGLTGSYADSIQRRHKDVNELKWHEPCIRGWFHDLDAYKTWHTAVLR